MNQDKLLEVLNFITNVECSDEQKRLMLEMAANTITVDKLSALVKSDGQNKETKKSKVENRRNVLKFSKRRFYRCRQTTEAFLR